ncbi:MFS transporter [Streptosporangiaceae bacterium NEAU-GS5]|nr:MFS transporter [Streptosporangiaceae bacterium NEAU-GS5]
MGETGLRGRPLLYWSAGVIAYMIAVFHRQSLGVTGLAAAERFGLGAAGLSMLAMLQLITYAGMQVPVGIMVDRLGSRRMLVIGATLMGVGQVVFAVAPGVAAAIAARALVGCGDAMSFISVIRIVHLWFPAQRNALFVQITGLLGALGGVASAVPLIGALRAFGWTPTFLAVGSLAVISVITVGLVLRDRPSGTQTSRGLRAAWAEPGTRLGMWAHAATQSSAAAFILLWGYPFLVEGQGRSPETAGVLLTVLAVLGMACGPLVGYLAGRFPSRRSWMVFVIVGSTATAWTAVLLWPGKAPLWLLVVLVVALAANGPGSVLGFDFARTFNPAERIGVASGIVNGGGFTATVYVIASIGIFVDLSGEYRWAFAVQYPVWLLGVIQVLRYRMRVRRRLALLAAPIGF